MSSKQPWKRAISVRATEVLLYVDKENSINQNILLFLCETHNFLISHLFIYIFFYIYMINTILKEALLI